MSKLGEKMIDACVGKGIDIWDPEVARTLLPPTNCNMIANVTNTTRVVNNTSTVVSTTNYLPNPCKVALQRFLDPATGWGCCAAEFLNGFLAGDGTRHVGTLIYKAIENCSVTTPADFNKGCPAPDGSVISGAPRQLLYFCTCKASKLSISAVQGNLLLVTSTTPGLTHCPTP
jgi:hypothetical protein